MNRSEILAKRLLEHEPEPPRPPEQEPTKATPPKLQTSADVKDEIDKLMPTRQYRFKGGSMWNAAGMLNLALRNFTMKLGHKEQKWSLNVFRAMNAPQDVIDALIAGRATIESDGNDAIVTVQLYGDTPTRIARRKRK